MMPSGHKAFLVSNTKDVELLMMHNRTYAAEYVEPRRSPPPPAGRREGTPRRAGRRNRSRRSRRGRGTMFTNCLVAGSPTTSRRESALTSSPARSSSVSRSRTLRRRSLLRSKRWINGECGDSGVYGFSIFGNHCIDAWEWICSMVMDGHEPGMYFVLENEIHLR